MFAYLNIRMSVIRHDHATQVDGRRFAGSIAAACLVVLLGIAALLRISIADDVAMWRDEAQTIEISRQSFPAGILAHLERDGNSPLFYLLEHFVVAERGATHRELRDRSLAVFFGLMQVLVSFLAAKRISDGSFVAGIVAAALSALAPVLVDLSTQARPYSAVSVVVMVMVLGSIVAETSRVGWLAYALAGVAGFYLHALFATTLSAFALVLLVRAIRRQRLFAWLTTHAAMTLATIPGVIVLRSQVAALTIDNGRIPWGTPPLMHDLATQARVILTGNEGRPQSTVLLAVALTLVTIGLIRGGRRTRELAAVAALALLFSFLLALRSGGFNTRYNTSPLVLMLLVQASACTGWRPTRRWAASAVAAASVLVVANTSAVLAFGSISRSDSRAVATLITRAAEQGDLVVIVPDTVAVSVNYYLPPGHAQADPPQRGRADVIDFRGWPKRLSDPSVVHFAQERMRATSQAGGRLWLVFWAPMLQPLPLSEGVAASALPAQWALGDSIQRTAWRHFELAATFPSRANALERLEVALFTPRRQAPVEATVKRRSPVRQAR